MKLLFLALLSCPVWAGGFYLNVKQASDVPQGKGALLVAQLSGCHEAEKGALTAVAEAMVDGKRQRVTLKTWALERAGWFAVEGPAEWKGRYVVVLSARHPAFQKPTLAAVPVAAGTLEKARAKWENQRGFTDAEIDSLLASR